MIRTLRLLPLALLPACATLMPPPPPPPPPPTPEFIVPVGTEFVSGLFSYSQAVRVGPWLTVSAQPGFDIAKRAFPKDFLEQVDAAFANLKMVLEASGASMNQVVEITSYQLDKTDFNLVVDGRNEAFGEHRPAWTALTVVGLPLPDMQFQVSARAYSPLAGVTPSAPAAAPVAVPPKKAEEPPRRFQHRPGY
ncbi:MAG: RidA family protein [Panacagrimonas sp.]